MTSTTDRALPHNIDAERSVLGATMMFPDETFPIVAGLIQPDDFFRDAHRRIFKAEITLDTRGSAIDSVTMREELARTGDLDEVGGLAYLASLSDGIPRSTNVEHYCHILLDKAAKRRLILAANKTLALAYADDEDATTVIAAADRCFRDVIERQAPRGFVPLQQVLSVDTMQALEQAFATKTGLVGLSTGFADWDRMTGGVAPGRTTLIAGSTSVGKTSLLTEVLRHIAVAQQRPVGIFSLEMTKGEIGCRLLVAQARVDGHRLAAGLLSDAEWPAVSAALELLTPAPLHVDDTGAISVADMRSRARRLQREHGCEALGVDYVQLMRATTMQRTDTRALELAEISRGLKALAKELSVPILVLSQLNRTSARDNRRPQLSDLRDSGALEQDADVVLLLHRDAAAERDLVEVIVAKNRSGPTGSFQLRWIAREMRFTDVNEQLESVPAPGKLWPSDTHYDERRSRRGASE